MFILNLDKNTGVLYLDNFIFDYSTEKQYLMTRCLFKGEVNDSFMSVNGFNKYGGFDIEFAGNEFSVEFVYKDGLLYSNSFIYNGLSVVEGFGAKKFDQKIDRKKLRADFKKHLGKSPEKKLKYRDLFVYDWGEVRISISHRDYYVFLNFDYY